MTKIGRWMQILLLPIWASLLVWKFIDTWTWRGWLTFGFDLFLLALNSFGIVSYLKTMLRNQRHVRLRPFPFPTTDVWPDLPAALNGAQQLVEDAARDPDPLYFIDLTYDPKSKG